MNRDDIIAMASKAFVETAADVPNVKIPNAFVARFAALVAAAEREACAEEAECIEAWYDDSRGIASAIRARGETK